MTLFPASSETTNDLPTWRRFRPRREGGRGSIFFWLGVAGLGCLSLTCVCWGAQGILAQKGSEKLLRLDLVLPKLKSNHGERKADAFRTSEPVPNALAQPKERTTLTPAASESLPSGVDHPKVTIVEAPPTPVAVGLLPTHEPPRFDPWPLMIAKVEVPPPAPTCLDPVVYLEPCAPPRGDTPMLRNWKMLSLYSLVTAATTIIAPPQLVAQEAKDTDELKKSIDRLIKRIDALEQKPTDENAIAKAIAAELKKLESGMLTEIKKSVDQTNNEVTAVQSEQRKQKKLIEDQKFLFDLLTGRVDALEKKLVAGGAAPGVSPVDKALLEEFRSTMKSLQEAIAKMGSTPRMAMSPPETTNGAPKLARIVLANQYSSELLFIINGVGHRLPANSTKLVENVPAGPLTYEVFSTQYGVLERRAVTLPGGDTFNLSAR